MAKYEKTISGNLEQVAHRLQQKILSSVLSMNLVDESHYEHEDFKVIVQVYDKYFYRNKSRASLTLTLVNHNNDIFVSAIGAGGGQGIIFNFSLGAEDEMMDVVKDCIEDID
ncbi:MAG TPA: DUF6054 family protein [Clostridia bacterium]